MISLSQFINKPGITDLLKSVGFMKKVLLVLYCCEFIVKVFLPVLNRTVIYFWIILKII